MPDSELFQLEEDCDQSFVISRCTDKLIGPSGAVSTVSLIEQSVHLLAKEAEFGNYPEQKSFYIRYLLLRNLYQLSGNQCHGLRQHLRYLCMSLEYWYVLTPLPHFLFGNCMTTHGIHCKCCLQDYL